MNVTVIMIVPQVRTKQQEKEKIEIVTGNVNENVIVTVIDIIQVVEVGSSKNRRVLQKLERKLKNVRDLLDHHKQKKRKRNQCKLKMVKLMNQVTIFFYLILSLQNKIYS